VNAWIGGESGRVRTWYKKEPKSAPRGEGGCEKVLPGGGSDLLPWGMQRNTKKEQSRAWKDSTKGGSNLKL